MSADDKQVGGVHYSAPTAELQHWNVVAALGWDYFIGNATKYLWRLGKKGGAEKAVEDIGKAIHYLEKKRELLEEALREERRAKPLYPSSFIAQASMHEEGEPGPGYVDQG